MVDSCIWLDDSHCEISCPASVEGSNRSMLAALALSMKDVALAKSHTSVALGAQLFVCLLMDVFSFVCVSDDDYDSVSN